MKNLNPENKNYARKKSNFLKIILISLGILIILSGLVFFTIFSIQKYNSNKITIKSIKRQWNEYNYEGVYESAKLFLQDKPYNNTALTYYGYACFYLAVSQNETYDSQEYLDESINTIRLAMYEANKSLLPQLQYMLGKAYFYKNTISKYYYADLAVKYLNMAKENGYEADDISEYLGLSYASLGMTMESISAFTEALLVRDSDTLLLSIAEQYYKAEQLSASEQYLYRIINNSENDEIILKSRVLLGNIYINQEKYKEATDEFNSILQMNANSADAHYGLGCIYEKEPNMVKARAEWRRALKIQPNHTGALKKLSE